MPKPGCKVYYHGNGLWSNVPPRTLPKDIPPPPLSPEEIREALKALKKAGITPPASLSETPPKKPVHSSSPKPATTKTKPKSHHHKPERKHTMAVTTLHPHKKPMKLPAGYAPNTSLAHENPKTMERLKSISFHCLVATFERFGWVRQMADAIGCSPSTIHNYLRGTRPSPGIEELCRKWLAENDYPIPSPKVEYTPPVQAIPTPEKAPEIPNKLEVPQYPKPFNPPAPKPAQEAEQPRLNLEAPTAPKAAPKAAAGDMAIMAMIMGPRAGVEKLLQAAQIWGLTVDFEE